MARASRGDVWMVNLSPTIGHEQAGQRPALIVSVDQLNKSAAELVIVVPLTSREKRIRSHVQVDAGEAGLKIRSFIKCEDVRSIATRRLEQRLGSVRPRTLENVENRLRFLLGL